MVWWVWVVVTDRVRGWQASGSWQLSLEPLCAVTVNQPTRYPSELLRAVVLCAMYCVLLLYVERCRAVFCLS